MNANFVKDVIPHVGSLHPMNGQRTVARDKIDKILEDQAAILEMDDILSYDSDEYSGDHKNHSIDQSQNNVPLPVEAKSTTCSIAKEKVDHINVMPIEPEIIVIDD